MQFQGERIHKLIARLIVSRQSVFFSHLTALFVNFAYLHESVSGLAMTATSQGMQRHDG